MPSLNWSRGKLITFLPSHSQERVYTWRVVVRQMWGQLNTSSSVILLDRTFAKWWIFVRTESESGKIKVPANEPIIRPSGTCDPIRIADNEHSWRDKFLKGRLEPPSDIPRNLLWQAKWDSRSIDTRDDRVRGHALQNQRTGSSRTLDFATFHLSAPRYCSGPTMILLTTDLELWLPSDFSHLVRHLVPLRFSICLFIIMSRYVFTAYHSAGCLYRILIYAFH